jgi:MFS family permease
VATPLTDERCADHLAEWPVSDPRTSPASVSRPIPGDEQFALDPATGRPAGRAQAVVLLLSSCLSVLGAVLLAPVLPRIEDAFAGTAGVHALTPMVLTAPALVIGLTATAAGRIVDRLGRKRLLVWALVAYAFVGTAPLWLQSLHLILLSRVLVGVTEAAIMTCCTTLLADYFHGPQRARYFGLQTVYTTIAATICFALGGALGSQNWRTPFWLYAVSLPLAYLAARHLWQPAPAAAQSSRALPPVPWRRFGTPIGVTLVGGLVFYALIVELSFVLDDLGVESTATIGAISAAASLATAAGAWSFARLTSLGPVVTIPAAFLLCGVGLGALGLAGSVPVAVLAALIAGLGNGLLLPALLTWSLGAFSFEQRGRATGAWTAALFIGQFVSPLIVLALSAAAGSLSAALVVVAMLALTTAMVVRLVLLSPARA